jgi:putative transcriptional regulator
MRLLRDKAGLTRLLLLLELQRTTHTKLKGLAECVGITVQGASNYVGEMEREGLVRVARGRYEVTPQGLQLLQERLAELKGFVDLAFQRVNVIETCHARAAGRVRTGERVGLFMEQGLLVARPRTPSASQGVAAHGARAGELLQVRALEGLVALKPGKVTLLDVPSATGAATRKAAAALRAWVRKRPAQRVGAVGTEAAVLADAAGLGPHFVFAPVHAGHHAAQLGLDVLLLVSPGQARFALAELEQLNEDAIAPVRYDVRALRVPR